VPAAAACSRHPAGHAIIYLFICFLFILYLSFIACSGSMREASCSSMMPAIMVLFIYYYF
jgi:hypothetical protein